MVWDNHKPFTYKEFREHVRGIAEETMQGLRSPPINGVRYLPYWWIRRSIRVSWESAIPETTVRDIVNAVDDRIKKILGHRFAFQFDGDAKSGSEQIAAASVGEALDEFALFSLALSAEGRDEARGGKQHGDIYITTKHFLHGRGSLGAADFKSGALVLSLPHINEGVHSFLRHVTLHETAHLLGMYCHCDQYQNVTRLRYGRECNMHYSCMHEKLCRKCRQQLRWWWRVAYRRARAASVLV